MAFTAVCARVRPAVHVLVVCIRYRFRMATVYVPGVAQTVLSGMVGSNPWAVVHHWKPSGSTAPWTQADLSLLVATIQTAWNSNLKAQAGNNVDIRQVTGVDLTNATGVGAINTFSPSPGTNASPVEPSSMAVVVQNRIASRYRGGHPRTFWPIWTITQMANEHQWNATILPGMNTNMANFYDAVFAASYSFGAGSLQHVIVRYTYLIHNDTVKNKITRTRNGLFGVFPVLTWVTQQQVGSQRKRLTI